MGWFRSSSESEGQAAPALEDRLASIGPGVPGRFPACDGLGYIDSIDIGHRFQIQHCKDCGHRWEYLFDAGGHVVGLTELDVQGQPVARTRIRPRPAEAVAPLDPVAVPAPAPAERAVVREEAPAPVDDVIDLREPVVDRAAADQMSPAEWLRHVRR